MTGRYSYITLIICILFSSSLSAESLSAALTKMALESIQNTQQTIQNQRTASANYGQNYGQTDPTTNTNSNITSNASSKKSYAYTELKNFNLSGKDLSGVNFQYATLENFDFSYADLSNARFAHATLINCDLRNANINNIDFSYTKFRKQTKIAGLDFSTADMSYSELEEADSTTRLEEKTASTPKSYEETQATSTKPTQSIQATRQYQPYDKKLAEACISDCQSTKRHDRRDCYEAYGRPAAFWQVEKNPRINDTINACLSNATNEFFGCKSACKKSSQTSSTTETYSQETQVVQQSVSDTESYTPQMRTVSQHTTVTTRKGKSYAHTTLSDMNFSNKDLQNTDFSYATLNNVTFKNTNLSGADFKYTKLHNVNFQGAILQNTEFDYSHMYDSDLRGSIVTNASFAYVEFKQGTKLAGVDFSTCDMQYTKMKGADFDTPLTVSSRNIERVLTQKPASGSKEQRSSINLAIQFEFNSSEVKEESMPQINEIATALQSESLKNIKVMVEGHTDAIGSNQYNQQLSEERATSVQQILTENYHIGYDRIYVMGFGEKRPIASNKSDSGRAQNRRVTITNLNS